MDLLKSKWIDPSVNIGGGYNFLGDASAGTVNGGLGLTFWFTEKLVYNSNLLTNIHLTITELQT